METETMVIVKCPSCSRPMNSMGNGWQCLACNPIPDDVPICKTQVCKRPLTRLGDPWNCWICLHCHDHPDVVNRRKKEDDERERKYLDKKLTEDDVKKMTLTAEDVRKIINESLAEFSLKSEPDPDYPPTRAEIRQIAESVYEIDDEDDYDPKREVAEAEARIEQNLKSRPKRLPWITEAKKYGIETHYPDGGGMRKKADILADLEQKKLALNGMEKAKGDRDGGSSTIEDKPES